MRAQIAQRTLRTDRWWLPPLVTVAGLLLISIYAAVRTFMGDYYWVDEYRYLTPMYSPCLSQECVEAAAHFGRPLPELPGFLTPPVVIIPFLLGFRVTCYYYRKAYYRAAWLSPPACAVAEPHAKYTGETRFPLIAQNLHRYFFYAASILLLINIYDAIYSLTTGLGLGNIVLLVNVGLLGAYTLSCHSCRHIAGGRLKHFSKHPVRYWMWTRISKLNARHMQLAWASLIFVCVTDFYVALVSSGTIADLRIIN
ncbi:hypothetical protein ABZ816_39505 [Actinosynnema sp. NPDC047251]|uniref:Integral membrane protein n=1 Tax=Saccharothrix espanaensis (strain ATCC 51144 / DSM 44229 / JCM 9112 / NBRC 15066 / NRRL 15764) TaxID=1179773 RepID=K0JT04_SACES|nr:hypothetical protein [Saccharothrix espanaensis]CCH29006.1 Integral membrane protein [Saccharothrix espanaensis DSM 44229]